MTPLPEPLSQEALDVLQWADLPEPSAGAEDRVLEKLRLELTFAPIVAVASAASVAPAVSKAAALGKLGVPVALASLGVGVLVGVLLHARLPTAVLPVEKIVYLPAPVPAPVKVEAVALAPVAPAPSAAPARRPRPLPVVAAPPPEKPVAPDLALAQERQLIEQARSALVRGEPKLATEALEKHVASFPSGRLAEERESLWVQTLVRRGDFAAARARATRFSRAFPNSLLIPAVEAALQSLPR